ncbi:glycerophosphodiester phosphodiesterase family protein [Qipengyuania sp. XHP0207]|uniref:glycerophosphodiester phosphodiesterase family protein n=1 Tax=Qipengyuania sp. XHP0207 TaxID=3038078 RepID=UPI0024201910|nr:glycerophosphodiester phosphodiesterase family protein [Qipengyuania sp. XHP0207]MDG5748265.1 glycerophosphodiester phosphodiesterase family protein [Qipengyuania sp. XHP0207]
MRSLLSKIDDLRVRRSDPARIGWLAQWTYAHRGLHGAGQVENSRGAFAAALAAGLGIECDIQRSADGEAMVFHDWDFTRLIGRPEKTESLTAAEWKKLSYLEGEEPPIALADLLEMVAGRVPLLIEIKSRRGYDVAQSCVAVAHCLRSYAGPHAVMSFDPRVSRWFAAHSPQTVQGLVMREDDKGYTQKAWQRHLTLWAARPEFLAYHIEALPNPMVAGLREAGLPIATWTVNSPQLADRARDHADALIAEGAGLA